MISEEKQLSACRNGERAATVESCREDGAHKTLREAATFFAELFLEEAAIHFFKGL